MFLSIYLYFHLSFFLSIDSFYYISSFLTSFLLFSRPLHLSFFLFPFPPPFLFFLVFILSRPFSSFHPSLLFRYCPFRWFYLISVSIHPSPSIQHSPPQGQWGRMQYTIKHALVSTYVLVLLEYFCQILFDL